MFIWIVSYREGRDSFKHNPTGFPRPQAMVPYPKLLLDIYVIGTVLGVWDTRVNKTCGGCPLATDRGYGAIKRLWEETCGMLWDTGGSDEGDI